MIGAGMPPTKEQVRPTVTNITSAIGQDDTSAGKVLKLLDAFISAPPVVGVTELAARANLSKSTAHRLLTVLVSSGHVRRAGDRYCLSDRLFEIGNQVWPGGAPDLRRRAMPFLADLFAVTRHVVHLAVLCGTQVLYVEKLFGHSSVQCRTNVGGCLPAHATALGKAMLAHSDERTVNAVLRAGLRSFTPFTIVSEPQLQRALEKVRDTGTATGHEEFQRGLSCIASPICDPRTGRAVAAISISASSERPVERFSHHLVESTRMLSRSARYPA
jgi:DNA-binding IclR family transcriptional regulator